MNSPFTIVSAIQIASMSFSTPAISSLLQEILAEEYGTTKAKKIMGNYSTILSEKLLKREELMKQLDEPNFDELMQLKASGMSTERALQQMQVDHHGEQDVIAKITAVRQHRDIVVRHPADPYLIVWELDCNVTNRAAYNAIQDGGVVNADVTNIQTWANVAANEDQVDNRALVVLGFAIDGDNLLAYHALQAANFTPNAINIAAWVAVDDANGAQIQAANRFLIITLIALGFNAADAHLATLGILI